MRKNWRAILTIEDAEFRYFVATTNNTLVLSRFPEFLIPDGIDSEDLPLDVLVRVLELHCKKGELRLVALSEDILDACFEKLSLHMTVQDLLKVLKGIREPVAISPPVRGAVNQSEISQKNIGEYLKEKGKDDATWRRIVTHLRSKSIVVFSDFAKWTRSDLSESKYMGPESMTKIDFLLLECGIAFRQDE